MIKRILASAFLAVGAVLGSAAVAVAKDTTWGT